MEKPNLAAPVSAPRMVRLRAYGGEIIERVLLGVENHRPIITSREEYDAALRVGREPRCLAWPASDYLGPVDPAQDRVPNER